MALTSSNNGQLGFDTLLADAETENRDRIFERKTAHLPDSLEEAIPYYRGLIEANHAAMLAADESETRRLHEEARQLARKLNGGESGILAYDDAPGYILAGETIAAQGSVPLWGQTGAFIVEAVSMSVHIEMEGMFGIGSGWGFWPGFAAYSVDPTKPFLSKTGYRRFLGIHADPRPGMTPEAFTAMVIETYVERELHGKLLRIHPRYRQDR